MNAEFIDDQNFFGAEDERLNEQQKKERLSQKMRMLDDIRWVLSNTKGRRVLWFILSLCGVFRASYVPKDSTQTAFNEGRRDVGLRLLLEIQTANPKAYSQMEDEVLADQGKRKKGD
jgi:hypothetical protein